MTTSPAPRSWRPGSGSPCPSTSSTLRAEPADRQVAEWVILMGGSVRLEGQDARIRELTDLPAADFHLELADLVGTNINPPICND